MDEMIPVFKFGQSAGETKLELRMYAIEMRSKIESVFNFQKIVICDFSGVATISDSYADECFGKLMEKNIGNTRATIRFENASKEMVETISKAIFKRLTEKTS